MLLPSISKRYIVPNTYHGAMRVLVTGGSGQLGSYLIEEFSLGHEVRSVDIRRPAIENHVPFHSHFDIRDEAVRSEVSFADVIVHAAAQVSVEASLRDPVNDADINVLGTANLLKASAESGLKLFVYVSSAAVYGDPVRLPVNEDHPTGPKSFYGVSKLSAENYVRAAKECYGLDYFIVRPFNFYSPRADRRSPYSGVITKFTEVAKEGGTMLIEGDGGQTRDFIHARDVARMIRMAVESDARNVTVNCGSGRGTSINELADTLVRLTGGKARKEHVAPRVGDIRHSVADVSVSKKLLGFAPQTTLEEGLRSFL